MTVKWDAIVIGSGATGFARVELDPVVDVAPNVLVTDGASFPASSRTQ